MSSDHIPFLALSAGGGHGGPDSTAWYIHQIEQPLALQSRHARQAVWAGGSPSSQLAGVFEDLCEGLVVDIPPLPESVPSERPPQRSADLTVDDPTNGIGWVLGRQLVSAIAVQPHHDEGTFKTESGQSTSRSSMTGLSGTGR